MAFKMKYSKGDFPFKPSPKKFLGGVIGKVVGGRRRRGGGGKPGGAIEAARAARGAISGVGSLMGGSGGGMLGGVFGGIGPNLPGKMLKGGGRAPGKFPGFGAMGAGPRGAAALFKKDKSAFKTDGNKDRSPVYILDDGRPRYFKENSNGKDEEITLEMFNKLNKKS